ncbi:MAG: hypothetical protein AB8B56_05750, partial [Crocinitomicaceae bacterium]
ASMFSQEEIKWSPPIISIDSCLFTDSARIELFFGDSDAKIMFSLNKNTPVLYKSPVFVSETSKMEAFVMGGAFLESDHVSEMLVKNGIQLDNVVRKTEPSEKYPESNGEITNRVGASKSYTDPQWVGYDSDSIVFEFTSNQGIEEIGLVLLRDYNAWILPPALVKIAMRFEDGTRSSSTRYVMAYADQKITYPKKEFRLLEIDKARGKVEYTVTIYTDTLPESHPGSGKKAWVFIDELIVK